MSKDIFDTSDLSDIPDIIRYDVENVIENNIIELFNIAKRKLHIDEITVPLIYKNLFPLLVLSKRLFYCSYYRVLFSFALL